MLSLTIPSSILTLQSGRSLIGSYLEAKEGKRLPDGVSYLNNLDKTLKFKCPSDAKATDLAVIDDAWACVAAHCVQKAADEFFRHRKAGKGKDVAFELCSQERFIASKVHSTGYIYRNFRSAIDELAARGDSGDGVVEVLSRICELYGLWAIDENAAFFLKYHFYTPQQMDIISARITDLCLELRKSIMSIVDAFAYSDHIINSPLGIASGDVYNTYFNQVRAANPAPKEHPYFQRLIRPLLAREPLQLDEGASMDLDEEIEEMIEERNANNGKKETGEEEPETKADKL